MSEYESRLSALEAIGGISYPAHVDGLENRVRASEVLSANAGLQNEEYNLNNLYVVAGRIRSIRNTGMFMDLYDDTGKIQVYSKVDPNNQNSLSADCEVTLRNLHLGDIVMVTGYARRTKRGELSLASTRIVLLTKALAPLPDSWDGLKDIETRYRQRYVDMNANIDVRNRLIARSRITSRIRSYLDGLGYLEVETPMLHPIVGGASARPFVTHHNALDQDFYLRIAPELYLKKMIVGGLDAVYEINRCFRNEGVSYRHNPEFTTLELYKAMANWMDVMNLTQDIFRVAATACGHSSGMVVFGDYNLDFSNFQASSMTDLVKLYTGLDVLNFTVDDFIPHLSERPKSWGHGVEALFEIHVEKNLIQPTFVTHLPADISPLAKRCVDDPRLTERFELFVAGFEVANGFSELNDSRLQRSIFEQQMQEKAGGNAEAMEMDESFIHALEIGLPPTGGLGIGIDRLVMLMTGGRNIKDVIAFPTLKSLD